MSNLLFQINEKANDIVEENVIIASNIKLLEVHLSMNTEQLNEAVTSWLSGILNKLSNGELTNEQKEKAGVILGAIEAVSNPDLTTAFNKGNLGTILQKVGDPDDLTNKQGLAGMLEIGNHPSARSFVMNAQQALSNPDGGSAYIKKIQTKIDQVMRKLLHNQRQQKNNPQKDPDWMKF